MLQLPDTTTEAGQTEASVMLARLMGLAPQLFSNMCYFRQENEERKIFTSVYPHGWYHRMPVNEAWKFFPNLYDPANMALAWRVLNWAYNFLDDQGRETFLRDWWRSLNLFIESPADAQRAWLDKILSLAIEAGMVDAAAEG